MRGAACGLVLLLACGAVGQIIFANNNRLWVVGETVGVHWTTGGLGGNIDLSLQRGEGILTGALTIATGVPNNGLYSDFLIPTTLPPGSYVLCGVQYATTPGGSCVYSTAFQVYAAPVALTDSTPLLDEVKFNETRVFQFTCYAAGTLTLSALLSTQAVAIYASTDMTKVYQGLASFSSNAGTPLSFSSTGTTYYIGVLGKASNQGVSQFYAQASLLSYTLQILHPSTTGGRMRTNSLFGFTWQHGNLGGFVTLQITRNSVPVATVPSTLNDGYLQYQLPALTVGTGYSVLVIWNNDSSVAATQTGLEVYPLQIPLTAESAFYDAAFQNQMLVYTYEVPSTATTLSVSITPVNPATNLDLYMNPATAPTTFTFDVASTNLGGYGDLGVDNVTIAMLTSGMVGGVVTTTVYFGVYGVSTNMNAFSLVVVSGAPLPMTALTADTVGTATGTGNQIFYFDNPAVGGQSAGYFNIDALALTGATGLFVSQESIPTVAGFTWGNRQDRGGEVQVPAVTTRFIITAACDADCSVAVVVSWVLDITPTAALRTLFPTPFVIVALPTNVPVTWNVDNPMGMVSLDFCKGNDAIAPIASNIADTGSYSWDSTATCPQPTAARIKITSSAPVLTRYSSLFLCNPRPDATKIPLLGAGEIAGIVIGGVGFIVLVIFGVRYWRRVKNVEDQKDDIAEKRHTLRMSRMMQFSEAAKNKDGLELMSVPGFKDVHEAENAKRTSGIPDDYVRNARATGVNVDRQVAAGAPPPPTRFTSITFASFDMGQVMDAQNPNAAGTVAYSKPAWAVEAQSGAAPATGAGVGRV